MARKAASCTVQARLGSGQAIIVGHAFPLDPINGATTVVDQAAVEAAIAVLEADAASPTQGHVNSLRTVWNTLVADIATIPGASDVVLSYNASTVVNKNTLRQAIQQLVPMIPETL